MFAALGRLSPPLALTCEANRRGGRAVECAGLENRYGRFRPSRVRIPPSPLAVRLRAFLPHGLPEDRPPARAFRAPTSPRLPHGRPLSIRGRPARGRDQCAGLKTGAFASSFDRNNDEIPRHYWKAPHPKGRLPGRREGVMRGSLPRNCPQLLPVRDVLPRHAQRTSPQHRRTAVHPELPEVRREGFLRVSEQVDAQLHAQVLTEGDA